MRFMRTTAVFEPGDYNYAVVLDGVREHQVFVDVLNKIVPHTIYGAQPAEVVLPQIIIGPGRVELRWCSAVAVFNRSNDGTYALDEKRSEIDPFDIRPDGRIMVTV